MSASSDASKGFSLTNAQSPYLLGNGIGPKIYHDMYEKWNHIETKTSEWFEETSPGLKAEVKKLIERMQSCDRSKHDEGVMSSKISIAIQRILPKILTTTQAQAAPTSVTAAGAKPPPAAAASTAVAAAEDKRKENDFGFSVIHQLYVPDKSKYRADVAIVDGELDTVHSIIEVKWTYDGFPESEATAYARCFKQYGVNPHRWLPVFLLAKDCLKVGVSFDGIHGRWAYSEIYNGATGLLPLMKFFCFFVYSAQAHRAYKDPGEEFALVDNVGSVIICSPTVIGNRVLRDKGGKKTMKFYANRTDAEDALARQQDMYAALEIRTNIKLHYGFNICVLVDDFIQNSSNVTYNHLINLAKTVDKLFRNERVHGDLRLPNILFGPDDTIHIIDFDWAGPSGSCCFPPNVKVDAFGSYAKRFIASGTTIPAGFDWTCLADILEHTCRPDAVRAALAQDLTLVCASLSSFTADDESSLRKNMFPQYQEVPMLNLFQIGIGYYSSSTKSSSGRKRKGESSESDSSESKRLHRS
jgi:hypothetical protein